MIPVKSFIQVSLKALESYFKETKVKCEYRLAPLDSKLYAIKTIEEEVIPQPPKGFNIYK
jgi:hypothetical protein